MCVFVFVFVGCVCVFVFVFECVVPCVVLCVCVCVCAYMCVLVSVFFVFVCSNSYLPACVFQYYMSVLESLEERSTTVNTIVVV